MGKKKKEEKNPGLFRRAAKSAGQNVARGASSVYGRVRQKYLDNKEKKAAETKAYDDAYAHARKKALRKKATYEGRQSVGYRTQKGGYETRERQYVRQAGRGLGQTLDPMFNPAGELFSEPARYKPPKKKKKRKNVRPRKRRTKRRSKR